MAIKKLINKNSIYSTFKKLNKKKNEFFFFKNVYNFNPQFKYAYNNIICKKLILFLIKNKINLNLMKFFFIYNILLNLIVK